MSSSSRTQREGRRARDEPRPRCKNAWNARPSMCFVPRAAWCLQQPIPICMRFEPGVRLYVLFYAAGADQVGVQICILVNGKASLRMELKESGHAEFVNNSKLPDPVTS